MSDDLQASESQAAEFFWQSSTLFYKSPGVSDYLLTLQNEQHLNVNEMLFALWFTQQYQSLLTRELAEIGIRRARRTKKWVNNIRETRFELEQQWQPPYPEKIASARDAILETEIKIEKLHQQKLCDGICESDLIKSLEKLSSVEESHYLHNLIVLCGEATSESDFLQLVMLWSAFIES